jgi:Protein of unknown function (DUF3102)
MPPVPSPSPAAEIVRLHGEIVEALRTSLPKAIRIGELLTEQKASLGHGNFLPWVAQQLPFSESTARNYMRVFRERDRLEAASVEGLEQAYKLLRAPEESPGEREAKSVTVTDLADDPLVRMLSEAGSPPDPSLVPAAGNQLVFSHGDTVLWIEPSASEGYYFVTQDWIPSGGAEGGHVHGTKRPVRGIAIPLHVRSLGAEGTVAGARRNRRVVERPHDGPLMPVNPRFFKDMADYRQKERDRDCGDEMFSAHETIPEQWGK